MSAVRIHLLIFLAIIFPNAARAATCTGAPPAGTNCVNSSGVSKSIDAFSICKVVTNNHASTNPIMVPVATAGEWLAFRSNLPAGVTLGTCPTEFVLTTSGNFTVPADWNDTTNSIECVGGGGGGGSNPSLGGGGGGGGAYAKITSLTLTPGASVAYQIGAGGSAEISGVVSWFQNSTVVAAEGGGAAADATGGAGGSSAISVGSIKKSGGTGATAGGNGGAGGGSSGGPFGTSGGNGGATTNSKGGGGGGTGGTAGTAGTTTGNGGNNFLQFGGGTGGSPGTIGVSGGGGGGSTTTLAGAAGGSDTDLTFTVGLGGGGGGGGNSAVGGSGGTHGGGGGGGGITSTGGSGAPGVCVVKYVP